MKIVVTKEIKQVCPEFVGACVEAKVKNTKYSEQLWTEVGAMANQVSRPHAASTSSAAKTRRAIALRQRL